MRNYYNEKKYYVKRAMKVAKQNNNIKAISTLKLLQRQHNVFPISFIQTVNEMGVAKANLFNIENKE